jgi:hypothetical protein
MRAQTGTQLPDDIVHQGGQQVRKDQQVCMSVCLSVKLSACIPVCLSVCEDSLSLWRGFEVGE